MSKDLSTTGGRRRPAQQRSRERLEQILSAAMSVISVRGVDQTRMSEIASTSAMSLGSVYQYFPDKAAIVRTLAERYNAASRACIEEALHGVRDAAGLEKAFAELLRQYLHVMRHEPVMRDIWMGMHADRTLSELQSRETSACAALLAEVVKRVHPDRKPAEVDRLALVVWELGEAATRLAIALPTEDGDEVIELYVGMMLSELLKPAAGR